MTRVAAPRSCCPCSPCHRRGPGRDRPDARHRSRWSCTRRTGSRTTRRSRWPARRSSRSATCPDVRMELDAAITDRTAAVFYVAGSHLPAGALDLAATWRSLHARGVPVIVDAAAQFPPHSNSGTSPTRPAPTWPCSAAARVVRPAGERPDRGPAGPRRGGQRQPRRPATGATHEGGEGGDRGPGAGRRAVPRAGPRGRAARSDHGRGVDRRARRRRRPAGAAGRGSNEAGQPVPRVLVSVSPDPGPTADEVRERGCGTAGPSGGPRPEGFARRVLPHPGHVRVPARPSWSVTGSSRPSSAASS